MNRRGFLIAAAAAGGVMTAEGLWWPGSKLISIPKPGPTIHVMTASEVFLRQKAWLDEAGKRMMAAMDRDVIFFTLGIKDADS